MPPLEPLPIVTVKDLTTDQQVRWCPGCGDYSILAQLKQVLSGIGYPRERIALVSGVGCAGRLPYYLNSYGFHTIHGRAVSVATGLKLARPELSVWVVLGDGDGFGPGLGGLLHGLRRNVDLKILVFNNEVHGLTRGQASPTSRPGTRTVTTPSGSIERPLRPLVWAIAAGATFAARSLDVEADHLNGVLHRAALHRGAAFVEIYQNCNVYNDGVFHFAVGPADKEDAVLFLEHGRPLVYGRDRQRGLQLAGVELEAVDVGPDVPLDDVLVHDEQSAEPTLALALSRLAFPDRPECFGVFRAVDRPTFEEQIRVRPGTPRPLAELLTGPDAWAVEATA